MKQAKKKPNKTARLKAMLRRKLQRARLRVSKGERKYSRQNGVLHQPDLRHPCQGVDPHTCCSSTLQKTGTLLRCRSGRQDVINQQ